MNGSELSLKKFLQVFIPIFFGFIFFRLMVQVNLIMLVPFGSMYLAAFSIPSKIMILDMLLAFSVGPVASIYIGQAKSQEERAQFGSQIILISTLISLIITILGFIIYPKVLRIMVNDNQIFAAASMMLFWSTLFIPFRMLNFIQIMMLHGLGRGNIAMLFDLLALLLCAPLNFILIKLLGVDGIYIASGILTALASFGYLIILKKILGINWRKDVRIKFILLKDFLNHGRQEFVRLGLLFGQGFILVFILSKLGRQDSPMILAGFSASSEFGQLVMMLYVAVMRSVAILSSKMDFNESRMFTLWKSIIAKILIFSLLISLITMFIVSPLGNYLYGLDGEGIIWWKSYLFYFALAMPFACINSFLRGILQAKKRFRQMLNIEIITHWVLAFPIILLGIYYRYPYVVWSWILLSEVSDMIYYLFVFTKENVLNEPILSDN